MNIADYLLIAIVVMSAVIGALRGFLREAVSVVSWILALFLAWHYAGALAPYLGTVLAQHPHARTWVARLIIVLVVLLIGALTGGLLGQFVRLSIFSGLDRFLGICFGAVRALVVIGALVIVGQMLRMDAEPWWRGSTLMPHAAKIADGLRTVVGEHWRPKELSV